MRQRTIHAELRPPASTRNVGTRQWPGDARSVRARPTSLRRCSLFTHRYANPSLASHLFGDVVAGVDVPDHAHGRVIGEHALDLAPGQLGAVRHAPLAGVDGATHPDAAAVMDRDPCRAGR